MGDINVTSHNQSGGITAQKVGSGQSRPPRKRRTLFAWIVGIAAIVAAIVAVADFFSK